jgi:hypothetical protein
MAKTEKSPLTPAPSAPPVPLTAEQEIAALRAENARLQARVVEQTELENFIADRQARGLSRAQALQVWAHQRAFTPLHEARQAKETKIRAYMAANKCGRPEATVAVEAAEKAEIPVPQS